MKILYLGKFRERMINFIESFNDVVFCEESDNFLKQDLSEYDFIISYGCRHIIPKRITDEFKGRAINLHISYLPYNRGSDPNLWSFIEDTPKGVTIHYVDEGLDTGDIIFQEEVTYTKTDTLSSTYNRLAETIEKLFMGNWENIKKGNVTPIKQSGKGSYHKSKDKKEIEHLLVDGWNTKVHDLLGNVRVK
jgi:methionyl-tRNA formyltransferase